MDLKIGSRIIKLRRKRGLTQEQLASALGVSAPAVSKWETGSSYPDITLLCPLARALGTDVDSLLAFEEDLPDEALSGYMAEVIGLAGEGKVYEAEARLNDLLHTYPSNIPLKFSATTALSILGMNAPEAAKEDKARWVKQKKELVRAIHDDGAPAYYLPAVSMLVSLALEEGELEKAESLLQETPTNTESFTMLWVRLYVQKGEKDKALETVQRRLYTSVGEVRTCLLAMLGQDLELDESRMTEICRVFREMEELFAVGGKSGAGALAEVYLRAGKVEESLECLEQFTEAITGQLAPPNPLLFSPAIAPCPERLTVGREMQMTILQGLKKDDCFAMLRDDERFQRLVQKLSDSLTESNRVRQL